MCDNERTCGESSTVRQIFYSRANEEIIKNNIAAQTGVPPSQIPTTLPYLHRYMDPLYQAAPGNAYTEPEKVLQHVHELNIKVVQWAARDVIAGKRMQSHYLKLRTGVSPFVLGERMQQSVAYGEKVSTTSRLLRDYTQFFEDEEC